MRKDFYIKETTMSLNTLVCLITITAELTFITESMRTRLGIRQNVLLLTATAVLALSNMSFRPIGEICFDASSLATPIFLLLFAFEGGYVNQRGKEMLLKSAAAAALPILISIIVSLAVFFIEGYAVFEFDEEIMVPWQFLLCGLSLGINDIILAKKVTV